MSTPVKTGYKTTEFWVTALTLVGLVLSSVADALPPQWAAAASTAVVGIYTLARGLAKGYALKPPTGDQ